MSQAQRWLLKYGTILAVSLKSRLAYGWEQVIGTGFMLIVMFVFIALWRTTYQVSGSSSIDGYTQVEMLWYLVVTETIVMSVPALTNTIDQEIKGGDLAYRLNKPYNYILFHGAGFIGETLWRSVLTFAMGGALVWLLVGPPPVTWAAALGTLVTLLLAQVLSFQYAMLVGLLAFWVEDTQGIWLLAQRGAWIVGGLLLPLEVFPGGIRAVVEKLPFRFMIYEPARLFVHFDRSRIWQVLGLQMVWAVVGAILVSLLYRAAVKRVNVNGG